MPRLLEVADLDQRRPQLDRRLDDGDGVVDDAQQVVLEKVRLKAIERFVEIGREQAQSVGAIPVGCDAGGFKSAAMQAGDLLENLLRVLRGDFAGVFERDAQIVETGQRGLDLSLE